jgi:hypothetical protein
MLFSLLLLDIFYEAQREKRMLGASQDSLRTFVSVSETKDPMSGQFL